MSRRSSPDPVIRRQVREATFARVLETKLTTPAAVAEASAARRDRDRELLRACLSGLCNERKSRQPRINRGRRH